DHSTQDLTSTAGWTSSDVTVATVSSTGLVIAVASGTTTVTATSGGINGSTTVTVNAASLQSIAVTPPNPSIAKGTSQQSPAPGTYPNNPPQDPPTQVPWASSMPSVATINSAGLASSVDVGSTSISAAMAGVSGSTVLTVTPATLQSIAV